MALKKLYIRGVAGLTYVEDAELHEGAEIFQVMRDGKPRYPTTGTPTGREFRHAGSETRIYFDADQPIQLTEPDTDPGGVSDLLLPEIIYVKFKN
jgi:hypothetical protein